jgi:hypothetical protein
MNSKNTKRLQQRSIGGKTIWTSYDGEDGYLVQKLATREKGLPDAYAIKDSSGVVSTPKATPVADAPKVAAQVKTFHPQVVSLATSLVGGTSSYSRSMAQASGVTPTMDAINEVRNDLIPLALKRIQVVGNDVNQQVRDGDLVAISKMVSAVVPRPIPRSGISDAEAILSSNNILVLQQDLDAFESALLNEDFSTATVQPSTSPDSLLNAKVEWIDPKSPLGKWLYTTYAGMTNHRHSYLSGNPRVINAFEVSRPDRDAKFLAAVKAVAAKRQGLISLKANLQPKRIDIAGVEDDYAKANVILTQHGTRSVNIAPILQTHFRLPRSLSGVPITGANFGHGIYHATDLKKAAGYTSIHQGYYSSGSGAIRNRGAFMFLCDMIMGDAYRAPSTGSWSQAPNGKDSVFGVGGDRGHSLQNDEHVIFDPNYSRIRYLIEFDF